MNSVFNIIPQINERDQIFEPLPVGLNPQESNLKFEINIRKSRLEEVEKKLKNLEFKKETDKDQIRWFISKTRKIKLAQVQLDDFSQIESALVDKLILEKDHLILELAQMEHSFTIPTEWKHPVQSVRVLLPRNIFNNVLNNNVFIQNLKDNQNCKVTVHDENQVQYLNLQSNNQEAIQAVKQSLNAQMMSFESTNKIKNMIKDTTTEHAKQRSRFEGRFESWYQSDNDQVQKQINAKYTSNWEKSLQVDYNNSNLSSRPMKLLTDIGINVVKNDNELNDSIDKYQPSKSNIVQELIRNNLKSFHVNDDL